MPKVVEPTLEDFWEDVRPRDGERRASQRPGSLRPAWDPPDIDKLQEWAAKVGQDPSPVLLVEGPTPAHRAAIYRLTKTVQDDVTDSWLSEGLVANLTHRISKVRATGSIIPHEWDLLWNLLTLETLVVEDSVRMLVDQGHLITEAFRAIWEARFRLEEGREVKDVVSALSSWMTSAPLSSAQREQLTQLGITREPGSTFERLDMLFFVLALAKQNELVTQTVFVFDGLDRAVRQGIGKRRAFYKELHDFTVTAERWARLGAPIGFMFGYSKSHDPIGVIETAVPKLGRKLRTYALV